RARRLDQLDYQALAEELEDMGRSERRAVENYLRNLLLHLLKWAVQTERRSGSWRDSIDTARDAIADLLRDSPSLRPHLPAVIIRQCERARRSAVNQTGMAEKNFPSKCPFTLDEILALTFFPSGSEREECNPLLPRERPHKKVRGPKKGV